MKHSSSPHASGKSEAVPRVAAAMVAERSRGAETVVQAADRTTRQDDSPMEGTLS